MQRRGVLAVVLVGLLIGGAILVSTPPRGPTHPPVESGATPGLTAPAPTTRLGAAGPTAVTFAESGLPPGTPWEVTTSPDNVSFDAYNRTSAAEFNTSLLPGVYNYTAGADRVGYEPYEANWTFAVGGAPLTVPIRFAFGFDLVFEESGLPTNESWNLSVTADGLTTNRTVAGNATEMWVPEGNYSFADTAVGFVGSETLGSGRLTRAGEVALVFTRPPVYTGTLTGTLNVARADVFLNGIQYANVTPAGFSFSLAPGIWTVFVTADGYLPYYNVTNIHSNQTVRIDVTLTAAPSSPAPPLLSAFADTIVFGLVVGIAVILVLYVVAARRLSGR
jgi:hypothetical protein